MKLTTLLNRLRGWVSRAFFWLPSKTRDEERIPEMTHDHALVLSVVSAERVPRLRQLRHLFRLLSNLERRVFLIALGVGIASLAVALAFFTAGRFVSVPVVGGTFTEAIVGEPKHLNPLDAPTNDVDRDLVRLLYSGLFRFDGTEPVLDLAEQYEWSDDRKTLTVHLRKDARFHDGEPVTPEDVRFTIESAQDPARKSALLSVFRDVRIDVKDDATIAFQLADPDAFFLQKLTVGILPAHLWQDIPATNARLSDLNVKPIGSGPYRVKSFLRDNLGAIHSYTLERFDRYHGSRPYIKTVIFQFFADRGSAVEALRSELVDAVAFVGADDAEKLRASGRQHEIRLDLPQTTVAFFNLKDKTLSDRNVRQALALAVNRADFVSALGRSAEPIDGPYPFETTTSASADLERARKILDDAGWILPQNGGIRILKPATPPPKKTTTPAKKKTKTTSAADTATQPPPDVPATASSTELTVTVSFPDDPELTIAADILKRDWSLLGAKVILDTKPTDELMRKATRDRDLQIVLLNVLLGPDQDLYPFWWSGQATDRGMNFSNLKDRAVDDALDKIQSATSTDAVRKAREAVSDTIQQSVPAAFLLRPSQAYFVSSKFNGLPKQMTIVAPAERFDTFDQWYLKMGWRWK